VAHPPTRQSAGRLREIALDEIHPNAEQPRKRFDEASLNALADSIRDRGVLQPIIVQPRDRGGYQVIAGERRWRASKIADQATIPALIDRTSVAAASLEVALIENIAREDLTVIEQARTIALLLEDLNVTATVLAKRLGRSRSDCAHAVRLLELPNEAVDLIDSGALSKGHGKALLTEPAHHRRRLLASRAAQTGWSVRTLEAEIARPTDARPTGAPNRTLIKPPRQQRSRTRSTRRSAARPARVHTATATRSPLDPDAARRLARVLDTAAGIS